MKENEKMSPESIKSLKEFNKKQIKTNIRIHKIFLGMIIIINIFLFNFFIMYKNQISEIKKKSNERKSSISQGKTSLLAQQNSIYHKLINIFAISLNANGNAHFSMLFEKSEEVQMVKKIISEYKKVDAENTEMLLLYQGRNDNDGSLTLLNLIEYYNNILIFIGTTDGQKFAFFFEDLISPNKEGFFESESDKCFIISFSSKEKYMCLSNRFTFSANKYSLFNIGDGDIVINHNFLTNGGIINFPFKTFDISSVKDNVFTKYNGEFDIYDIEIYIVF